MRFPPGPKHQGILDAMAVLSLLGALSCKSPEKRHESSVRDGMAGLGDRGIEGGADTSNPAHDLDKFWCRLGECLHPKPGSMCGPILCRSTGPERHHGFIRTRRSPFRTDRNLRAQVLTMRSEVFGTMICALQMAERTPKVGGHLVWFDVQLHTDGHLSLHSARSRYETPKMVHADPKDPVDEKTRKCMEESLVGKTIYDPKYRDSDPCRPEETGCSSSPRITFPEAVLEFEVWVPNHDPLDWPEGE